MSDDTGLAYSSTLMQESGVESKLHGLSHRRILDWRILHTFHMSEAVRGIKDTLISPRMMVGLFLPQLPHV
jgi:hypothetical protein